MIEDDDDGDCQGNKHNFNKFLLLAKLPQHVLEEKDNAQNPRSVKTHSRMRIGKIIPDDVMTVMMMMMMMMMTTTMMMMMMMINKLTCVVLFE